MDFMVHKSNETVHFFFANASVLSRQILTHHCFVFIHLKWAGGCNLGPLEAIVPQVHGFVSQRKNNLQPVT